MGEIVDDALGKLRLNKIKGNVTFEDEHGKIIIRRKDVKHLMVKDGDVFVFRQFDGLTEDVVESLRQAVSDIGLNDSIVVVVRSLSDLRTLDEEKMNAHGWFRKQESE